MLDDLSGRQWLVCHLVITASITMLIAPLFRYALLGWKAKQRDIMDGFDPRAIRAYFGMFSRGSLPPEGQEVAEFEKMYTKWYGRRFFILPGIILFVVGYLAIAMVVYTAMDKLGYIRNPIVNLPETAVAALCGAYLWVVHDQILRSRRLDFSPSDVLWASLRIVIAVPLGYAIASILTEVVAPFIAFAMAAFPLSALLSILRRIAEKKGGLGETADEGSDDLVKLQGMNRMIVERLNNEDITTITQIAYCDPIRVVMRSNLSFNFVSDCMNQALAWMYLEDKLAALRPLGLRGAIEIRNFVEAYDDATPQSEDMQEHECALAAFPKIAAALKQEPETVQLAFREIAGDPFTRFLSLVWS